MEKTPRDPTEPRGGSVGGLPRTRRDRWDTRSTGVYPVSGWSGLNSFGLRVRSLALYATYNTEMQITQTRTPIEETSDEQTTTTAIADGGHRSQIERLTDAVEFDYGGDRDGYPFVNLWVTDPVADDRFRMTCVHIDDYYADPEVAAHAFRSAWLESFDELLEPISAEGWLTLREHWERADDDDSAEVEA